MFDLRGKLALGGGVLIFASGLVSIVIGVKEGFLRYEPDPAGIFGHVGILAGCAALAIGAFLAWLARHEPTGPAAKIVAGLVTVVVGHVGAVMGALLVGTAGLLLSYVAGFWLVIRGIRLAVRPADR